MSNISGISGFGSGAFSVNATNAPVTLSNAQAAQPGNPFANLNLTTAQQSQIQQILQNANAQGLSPAQVQSQIDNVLTPAQQTQLQTDLSNLKKQHHHHHHGGGADIGSNDGTDEFGIPTTLSSTSNAGTISNIAAAFSAQSQLQNENAT